MSTAAIVVIALLCLVIVALIVALDRAQDRATDERVDAERRWANERRELLTRVQHPHLVPVPERAPSERPPAPSDVQEMARIGTITLERDAADNGEGDVA